MVVLGSATTSETMEWVVTGGGDKTVATKITTMTTTAWGADTVDTTAVAMPWRIWTSRT
jgi:hypothetical protein